MSPLLPAALLALMLPSAVPDHDRPSEDSLFGAPSPAESAERAAGATHASPDPAIDETGRKTEEAMFGAFDAKARETTSSREVVPEDPLKIGGQFYMRAMSGTSSETPPAKWGFSMPALVDGYFDARPNERVRGFLLARLNYDPTLPDTSTASPPSSLTPSTAKPLSLALDQLWLRFDVLHTLFVTAGRQHVKWGPSHFWNPTDFLHNVRRNLLDPFDARIGTTMVKVQMPWEKYGWNVYGVGIFEDLTADGTLGRVGGALRTEVVVGLAEIGAEAVFQRGHKPRLGADISAGLGPLDIYAEAALRKGWETPLWRISQDSEGRASTAFETWSPDGYALQATGGVNWSLNYMDVNVLTFGAEYFYNSVGYDDKDLYPWLVVHNAFTPFYLGKHYLGLYGMFSGPASLRNLNLILSNLANLSDRSFITRVDASIVVLTHLRVEAYTALHYGNRGGEFRFAMDVPATDSTPGFSVPAPLAEFGLGLRISI